MEAKTKQRLAAILAAAVISVGAAAVARADDEAETMVPGEAVEEEVVTVPVEEYLNTEDPFQQPWYAHHYAAGVDRDTWKVRAEQAEGALIQIYAQQLCDDAKAKHPRGCGIYPVGSFEKYLCTIRYQWCQPIQPAKDEREEKLAKCWDYRIMLEKREAIKWFEENGQAASSHAGLERYSLQTIENGCLNRIEHGLE